MTISYTNFIDSSYELTCNDCESLLDRDCFGDERCLECDDPCPGCYSG